MNITTKYLLDFGFKALRHQNVQNKFMVRILHKIARFFTILPSLCKNKAALYSQKLES